MSLRDRLAGKARRREVITVQVSDPTDDRARAAAARAAHVTAQFRQASDDELARLAQELEDAEAAERAHFEQVEFQALAPADFDALVVEYSTAEDGVDADRLRPVLAAECAVDPDLRDAEWWAAEFASGRWSPGELDDLYHRLFAVLHYSVPAGVFSKG